MDKGARKDVGHSIAHAGTEQGKGGERLAQDTDDASPTNRRGAGGENAKNEDFRSPSGDLGGQDPEDVAERMRSTGKDSGIA